jgi:chromosome segregation ATPase
MTNLETLDERLRAVERALTGDDSDLTDLRDAAELTRDIERLAARLDDAEECLDELDAATQALRGYVGNVRAVNESVERRADAALAKAESVEAELEEVEPDETESGRVASRRVPACECECRCDRERRRRGGERALDAPPESDDGESGPLARIAEALT